MMKSVRLTTIEYLAEYEEGSGFKLREKAVKALRELKDLQELKGSLIYASVMHLHRAMTR